MELSEILEEIRCLATDLAWSDGNNLDEIECDLDELKSLVSQARNECIRNSM